MAIDAIGSATPPPPPPAEPPPEPTPAPPTEPLHGSSGAQILAPADTGTQLDLLA